MGIAIPQVITPSKASGAQVIDGSLKFDSSKTQYLKRTPGSAGNRKTWTISWWQKRNSLGVRQFVFEAGNADTTDGRFMIRFSGTDESQLMATRGQAADRLTSAVYRDFSGWAHYVVAVDTTASGNDKIKVYKDGTQIEIGDFSSPTNPGDSADTAVNMAAQHTIGYTHVDSSHPLNSQISQYYLIDGQQLGSEYFGFTDPLTNTWKPKKYTGTFGTNGFYLPMDGNSPIGKDQSGNGNDFTPVNFGGSLELDNPNVSGARPILNTTQGGSKAGVSVFGSKQNVGYAVTVYNDGGGNKYYIDGVKQDTVTGLIRGATYTFDTSDSTVSSHPFRFSATSNGSHGGGSEYTDGVAAITGAATTITVPHNAPNTLYYYCTSHSGMGADITGITTNEKLADQYASKCVLALPLVGPNSDVSASITCTSTTKSISKNGSPSSSPEQSNFYGESHEFDGSGDFLRTTVAGGFGSGDFTMEFWYYKTADSGQLFNNRTNGDSGDGFDVNHSLNATTSNLVIFSNATVPTNKWVHVAFVRNSGTFKRYIDGVESASTSNTTNFSGTTFSIAGNDQSSGNVGYLTGYMQDFRTYVGVAKYTSDFVVPSSNPDILPDTPSGVSGGSKLTKITEGAVNMDTPGYEHLSVPASEDFNFGTGDFTIEGYFYIFSSGGNNCIFDLRDSGSSAQYFLKMSSASAYELRYSGSSLGSFSAPKNRWNHIAISRSSATTKIFVNGIVTNSFSDSNDASNTGPLIIGSFNDTTASASSFGFNGAVSNFRVIKGTALYTSRFTPPSAPLTNVTNTKLLCCQSNTSANSAAVSPATFSNSGDVYSSGISGSQDNTNGGGSAAAFDGQLGNEDGYGSYPNAGQTLTWTAANSDLGTTLAYSSTIRVYVNVDTNGDDGGLTVVGNNGSQTISAGSAGGRWVDISAATSPITSIAWSRASSGSQGVTLVAVEVDGSLLIDGFNGKAIQRFYDVAATTFNPFNTDINTVRGQESGYATLNPLNMHTTNNSLSNGNLEFTTSGSDGGLNESTLAMSSGKFYFEVVYSRSDTGQFAGIRKPGARNYNDSYIYVGTGNKYIDGGSSAGYGAALVHGDVIGTAFDADNGTLEFFKNGQSQGQAFSGISGTYSFFVGSFGGAPTGVANFGQKPFKFPPPDGFSALNIAATRPVKVISRPDQYVGIVTYSGAGGTQSVTGYNFNAKPDFVWIKNRSDSGGASHILFDTVRGAGKSLNSNETSEERTNHNYGYLTSFDFNGYTVTEGSSGDAETNDASSAYIAWAWKAGGDKGTFNVDGVGYASAAAAGLDGGSTNPTAASVNTKSKFGIYTFDGNSANRTLSHGLGQQPDFMIVKKKSASGNSWVVWHKEIANDKYLILNNDNALDTDGTLFNTHTSDSNTLWTLGSNTSINETGQSSVAYLWCDVPGLQKFGTYEGLNNSNGPFVELGFNPAIIWTKGVDSSSHGWEVHYNRGPRLRENPQSERLMLNESGPIASSNHVDFLSNGFKIRNTFSGMNSTTDTYIYCAWADVPTVDLYGGGANAR